MSEPDVKQDFLLGGVPVRGAVVVQSTRRDCHAKGEIAEVMPTPGIVLRVDKSLHRFYPFAQVAYVEFSSDEHSSPAEPTPSRDHAPSPAAESSAADLLKEAEALTCDGRGSMRFTLPDGRQAREACLHCRAIGQVPGLAPSKDQP